MNEKPRSKVVVGDRVFTNESDNIIVWYWKGKAKRCIVFVAGVHVIENADFQDDFPFYTFKDKDMKKYREKTDVVGAFQVLAK